MGRSARTRRVIAAIAALTMLGSVLTFSYRMRLPCLDPVPPHQGQVLSCYSELHALYSRRGLDRFVVYGGDGDLATTDGDFEYPPGIALVARVAQAASHDKLGFFRVNVLFVTAAALLIMLALSAMCARPSRLLLVAASPSMLLHAYTNWELLAVLPMVLGLWAIQRRKALMGGALLGAGAAVKVFPGFVLPAALAALRLMRARLGSASAFVVSAGGALAAAIMTSGAASLLWMRFNAQRGATAESIWSGLDGLVNVHVSGRIASAGSLIAIGSGIGIVILIELRRARMLGQPVRVHCIAFASVCVMIAGNKVFSPQVMLMVVPFFALVRVPWAAWVLFGAVDLAGQIVRQSHFIYQERYASGSPLAGAPGVRAIAVVRVVVLLLVAMWAMRSDEAVWPAPASTP